MAHDTLDEAILYGVATEDERCDNVDCDWCRRAPDDQAREEVEANLNPTPWVLRNACTDLEREQRLILLEGRERAGHQILNGYDAPILDKQCGARLNVNGRMQDFIEELKDEITRLTSERDRALNVSFEWEQLYSVAVTRVLELTNQRDHQARIITERDETIRAWEQRVDTEHQEQSDVLEYLTSGLKSYASHAWNDIKRDMEKKGWL